MIGTTEDKENIASDINRRQHRSRERRVVAISLACLIAAALYAYDANAACKWVWVDQDHDASTPAVRKQLCDRVTDVPAIKTPSIRPIQTPTAKPIQTPTIPPIGTKKCTVQRVYESGRWVNKQVCK